MHKIVFKFNYHTVVLDIYKRRSNKSNRYNLIKVYKIWKNSHVKFPISNSYNVRDLRCLT